MPAHAPQRAALVSRPRTVLALSMAVATLAAGVLVQSPQHARAGQLPALSTAPAARQSTTLSLGRTEGRHRQQAHEKRQEQRADERAEARHSRRTSRWTLPVPGAGWSASFGESGSAWSSGFHTGQDFTAPSGTPIHAVGPGTITSAAYSGAYGNLAVITHQDGSQSWYAHLSGFKRSSGSVSAGDVIGYVGCTGNCYGSHVHFEYHPRFGDAADPLPWLRGKGAY
ncbi:MAG: M23 family metallopeptidase [Actinomycetes bacterium]